MNIKTVTKNNRNIAVVNSDICVISGIQSALDFAMTVKYETGVTDFAVNKEAITEDFFILSTGLAGEILQKYINYGFRLAVYGDFSGYTSKPLKDFIRESNKGKDFFFMETVDRAVEKLAQ